MLHVGRGARDQPIVASTLLKIFSDLVRCFELREPGMFWHMSLGGKPANVNLVRPPARTNVRMRSHLRRDDGNCGTGAVSMTPAQMHKLLDYSNALAACSEANIDEEAGQLRVEPHPESALGRLLRTAAFLSLLWRRRCPAAASRPCATSNAASCSSGERPRW
jgi:hypothetical protein